MIILGITIFKQSENQPIPVTFSKVERRTITQIVSATGKIQPEVKVNISPETSGEIIYLGVKEGDTVNTQTLLARINPDIIETQLEQFSALVEAAKQEIASSKTSVDNALLELNRTKDLYSKKFSSQQELDQMQSKYDMAVASYNATSARFQSTLANYHEVQKNAQRLRIYSPLSGVVTSLNVELGEKVVGTNLMAGTGMMTISDLDVMNAEVEVAENDIILVNIGDTASIEIDALPDKIYKGVVVEVGHSAISAANTVQDQTTNFSVKIRLIDKEIKLRPGMSCNVEIYTEVHQNVLSVPLPAVTTRDKPLETSVNDAERGSVQKLENNKAAVDIKKPQTCVFIKDNNKAKLVNVEIGISDRGYVEILSGLKEKEQIISGSYQAVSKLLQDGALVTEEKTGVPKKHK